MITFKKPHGMKCARTLLRWLTLSLLLANAHVFAQSAGTVTYVYTDPQGTPLAETDANGNITATFDYTPYGTYAPQGTSAPGPAPKGPGYTGHVNDPETNLVYMQARYYDPATGRFLSRDPVEVSAGNGFNFNRYAYADNNPIVHTDPDGRDSVGENIDENAQASANAGNNVATFGWAFAGAAWNLFGAESVSQVADKGTDASTGDMVMAAVTVVTLGKGEEAANVVKGVAEAGEDAAKPISGMTGHAVDQAINRGVKPAHILDAVKNPLKTGEVKIDSLGRPSQASIGAKATVVMNPETKKIVTVYPTSSKKAASLMQQ